MFALSGRPCRGQPRRGRPALSADGYFSENPFHPSLHFKCINAEENIWSVRVTLGCRAIGVMDKDTVTWFWIGDHNSYEKYFG